MFYLNNLIPVGNFHYTLQIFIFTTQLKIQKKIIFNHSDYDITKIL